MFQAREIAKRLVFKRIEAQCGGKSKKKMAPCDFLGKPIASCRILRPVLPKRIAAYRAESLTLRE